MEIPTEIFMASQLDHRILMKDIMFMVGHAEMSVAAVVEQYSVVVLTRWAVSACKQLATIRVEAIIGNIFWWTRILCLQIVHHRT